MTDQWTGPLQDPPFWLNPDLEWTEADEPEKYDKAHFVIRCIAILLDLGCNIEQAIGVTANAVAETGWGKHYRANNLGGVKANRNNTSANDRWWRALGHERSGDSHTCFYKAFHDFKFFFTYWLQVFAPRPGTAPKSRYRKTGEEFWAGRPWFDDLIVAGYKGEVTKMHPDASIEAHGEIVEIISRMWLQSKVGVDVDGKWGVKSQAAAAEQNLTGSIRDMLWMTTHRKSAPGTAPVAEAPVAPAPTSAPVAAPIETPVASKEKPPFPTPSAFPKGPQKTSGTKQR